MAIGVAGRWAQPQWCFTPTAAAAIFAGAYFARLGIAALVPIAILGISDLALESHDSIGVMLATYAVMTVPVLFGRWLRTSEGRANTLVRLAVCGLVPAILFWLVSNFAVWAFQSDYEKSWAGLTHCYLTSRAVLPLDARRRRVLPGGAVRLRRAGGIAASAIPQAAASGTSHTALEEFRRCCVCGRFGARLDGATNLAAHRRPLWRRLPSRRCRSNWPQ